MPAVYILTNKLYGTLYVGFTNDLPKRVWEHQQKLVDGFSKEYGLDMLVWYEMHDSVVEGRLRERQIKKWNRDWKINLIQGVNPGWRDLSLDLTA
jgi:putative endonuclease